jgi:hypothetical protein
MTPHIQKFFDFSSKVKFIDKIAQRKEKSTDSILSDYQNDNGDYDPNWADEF